MILSINPPNIDKNKLNKDTGDADV